MSVKLGFNILAITGSAMYAGVMLTIGIILGGHWKSLPIADFLASFENSLQYIPKAISFVSLAAMAWIVGSVWVSWGEKEILTWWILSAICIIVLLVFTFIWFGPTNGQFVARSLPMEQISEKLNTWLMLHNIRITLAALASVFGVIALNRWLFENWES